MTLICVLRPLYSAGLWTRRPALDAEVEGPCQDAAQRKHHRIEGNQVDDDSRGLPSLQRKLY